MTRPWVLNDVEHKTNGAAVIAAKPWPKINGFPPVGIKQSLPQWPSEKKAAASIVPVKTECPIDHDVDVIPLVRVASKGQEFAAIDAQVSEPAKAGEHTPRKSHLMPAWKPGESGNKKGRPKGARSKISEAVYAVILADVEHAAGVLARIREKDPIAWFSIVLRFVPAEHILKIEKGKRIDYSEVSDEMFPEEYAKEQQRKTMENILSMAGEEGRDNCRRAIDADFRREFRSA
jgi:hypothetical protein